MELLPTIAVLFLNGTALQYAISVALLLAPIYAFLFKPLIRWSRQWAARKAVVRGDVPPSASAAGTYKGTSVRRTGASSKNVSSPEAVGATPASFVPIFAATSRTTLASKANVCNGSSDAIPCSRVGVQFTSLVPQDAMPNGQGPPCSLEVTGRALKLGAANYQSPAERFLSAVRRHVRQSGAALVEPRNGALRPALQSGEVYLHSQPSWQLPSQDNLAQRLLYRHRLQEQYENLNITDASLETLYARPAFQEWYAANREQLLCEMRFRESSAQWGNVAKATVLLVAFMMLPAYSFSSQTNAMQWVSPLTYTSRETDVSAAPLVQLLVTRLDNIQSRWMTHQTAASATLASSWCRTDACLVAITAVKAIEYVGILAAVCALMTSCFMPHDSVSAASIAVVSLLFLVWESAVVPMVAVKLGLGSLVLLTVVAMCVYRTVV